MNVGDFLVRATTQLQSAGIPTARLDCLIVLEDVLGQDRASLLAHPEMEISAPKVAILNKFITQRRTHLPLAYYRGKSMFYGRNFIVNEHVLVPRPESESIIDLLKKCPLPAQSCIADVGAGSGVLGITAGLEIPDSRIYLYDIERAALACAMRNVALHRLPDVHTKQQDLLTRCQESFDVILANLPYVPNDYPVNKAASHEPAQALFSGSDGLDHYRRFWKQVAALDHKPAFVIVESLPEQHDALKILAAQARYILEASDGYALSLKAQRPT